MTNMGPRNLLILFFSTVAVSLVILIIFFSLFFKNLDINFNAKLPESAPDLGTLYSHEDASMQSKAEGLLRSTINVPPEVREFVGNLTNTSDKHADREPSDSSLSPVSDDIVLEDKANGSELPPLSKPSEKRAEKASEMAPESSESSGPPVPGQ